MINKDVFMLEQAYNVILTESKKNKKPDDDGDGIPNWAEKTTKKSNKKTKPTLKKEEVVTSFKTLFNQIINEALKPRTGADLASATTYSGPFEHDKRVWMLRKLSNGEISEINDEEQYIVTWKDPAKHNNQQEQPLKGESVHSFLGDITSLRRAFSEQE
jgi:hypothetical protein